MLAPSPLLPFTPFLSEAHGIERKQKLVLDIQSKCVVFRVFQCGSKQILPSHVRSPDCWKGGRSSRVIFDHCNHDLLRQKQVLFEAVGVDPITLYKIPSRAQGRAVNNLPNWGESIQPSGSPSTFLESKGTSTCWSAVSHIRKPEHE